MKRYTLHQGVGSNGVLADQPTRIGAFTTQKDLAEEFEALRGNVPAGQYLVGFDNRKAVRLHFHYKSTDKEQWNHRTQYLESILKENCDTVREWTNGIAKLLDDPKEDVAYAFRSADEAMRAAASITVHRQVLEILRKGKACGASIEEQRATLYAEAMDKVLRDARWPSRSTSPMHNLNEQNTLAVWADLVERFAPKE